MTYSVIRIAAAAVGALAIALVLTRALELMSGAAAALEVIGS